MNALDGSSVAVSLEFVDDDDAPLSIKQGYPRVILRDSSKNIISSTQAMADVTPGIWKAQLPIPMMGISTPTDFTLHWVAYEVGSGQRYTHKETLTVEPKVEVRDSDIVVMEGATSAKFTIPKKPDNGEFDLQLYSENIPLFSAPLNQDDTGHLTIRDGKHRLGVKLNLPEGLKAQLRPHLLMIECEQLERPVSYTYKLWCITPQIAVGMSALEDFLNKARIENTIAELQWSPGDLVHYLERGLNMFNTIGTPTAFTGTNMMGQLYECWLLCSTYYAISAQLIAEGSLSFDFSGQGVSLNVDRTPQLDSALGRIEARIQDTVLPFKKLLAKTGNLSGDGSVGKGMLQNPYAFGTLNMLNAPTTRVRGFANAFRRS